MLWLGILIGLVAAVVLVYVSVIFGLTHFSLYPPRIHQFVSPAALGFAQEPFETVTKDGVTIRGWYVPGESDVVFVACHGYLVNRCEWVPTLSFLGQSGASFVFFDHRGQGQSSRAKITLGRDEAQDVEAVLAWVAERAPGKKTVALGSSMGAVAAVLAGSANPDRFDALILDGPYRSLDEASRAWWLFLAGKTAQSILAPSTWVGPLFIGFSPKGVKVDEAISKLEGTPILLCSGTEDPIVPVESAKAILAKAGSNARAVWFDGCTHGAGRLVHSRQFEGEVTKFLAEHGLAPNTAPQVSSRF